MEKDMGKDYILIVTKMFILGNGKMEENTVTEHICLPKLK